MLFAMGYDWWNLHSYRAAASRPYGCRYPWTPDDAVIAPSFISDQLADLIALGLTLAAATRPHYFQPSLSA
jgi:hypothetical protein